MSNSFGARARKFMGWYSVNEPIDQFDQFEDFDEVDEVEEVAPVADGRGGGTSPRGLRRRPDLRSARCHRARDGSCIPAVPGLGRGGR